MRALCAATAALLAFACIPTPDSGDVDPIVVITFDDGHHSVYELAYPLMRARDTAWGATHFLPLTYPGQAGNVTVEQLGEMERGGWETGGHGATHQNLSSVPLDEAERDISANRRWLEQNGLAHESYAYAYGNYNDSVQAIAQKYFRNIRTSHDYKYLSGVNRVQLGAYDAKTGMSTDDFIARIEEARAQGSSLVMFCFHVIVPDTAQPDVTHGWWSTESSFTGLLDYLHDRGMRVLTVRDAMRELTR